ncbi:serine/threonine-protein kinase [Actinomycetospora termitidis]|uniref:Serine/threonine-protein kinase n=1 Tax=Actinomycetospora termitidis TaxID=3053470 RepID=A0ABT7MCH6_9PSEU|nr:serine/threonine-protein kinase [Actinomycetospora sp. Odt1-22]MDL5158362.1 serine/threonine-protein kinase [Actinomycetospora sp. Odt1-22]
MERIGQYELLSLIGEGGMGEVWRARDLRHDRDVALKLLPTSLSESTEYQRRFRRESHLHARLREPHLIPIHDYGEIDGRLFIDMRLVEGRSLQDVLRDEGPLPAGRTVALLGQIADALDAAHADDLVHRDVKPSNVLVTRSDFVYVVDFGLAFSLGTPQTQLTGTGVALGTLEYMAPERFSRSPVDGRTDVYSLACVLFECLTKEKPFPGDLPTQMFGHINVDPPRASERYPGAPAALDAVIARGMAKDPDDRFPTAGALVTAARAALRAAPTSPAAPKPTAAPTPVAAGARSAPPAGSAGPGGVTTVISRPPSGPPRDPHPSGPMPGAPEPPPTPPRRRRGLLWGAVAVVVVLVAALAVFLTTGLGGGAPTRPAPVASSPRPTVVGTVPVGAAPVDVQVAPDGRTAYVANRDAATITVLDTARGAAVGTIPLPGAPQALAFAPDGARAYVGLLGDTAGEVAVVDTADGSLVGRIPTGPRPLALAVSADGGRVFVSDPDAGSVTVIDTGSDTVVDRVALPTPHGLAVSPDGARLAVANYDANTISLVGTDGSGPVATTPVGRNPHAVAWHPTQPWVFDTDFAGNSVSVTDVRTGRVVATVPTAVHPQAVTSSADGRHVYVAAIDANVVQVVDTTTFAVTATIPTGRGPSSVAVTPDGRTAYVTDLLDGTLTVLAMGA